MNTLPHYVKAFDPRLIYYKNWQLEVLKTLNVKTVSCVSKLYALETFTTDQTSVYYIVYQCLL